MNPTPTILIAGIGNIFHGDDAFGSEVARRLAGRTWPAGVQVGDFGIRGIDLVYALLDRRDLTILIDATPRGGPPGTLYTLELDVAELPDEIANPASLDSHSMNPMNVLRTVRSMGGTFERLLLVGCEPADLGGDEGHMGLSPAVAAAVPRACETIVALVDDFLASRDTARTSHATSH